MSSKSNYRLNNNVTTVKSTFPPLRKAGDKAAPRVPARARSRVRFCRGKFRLFGHYVHAQFLILAVVEASALICANYAVFVSLGHNDDPQSWLSTLLIVGFISAAIIFSLAIMGLYDGRQRESVSGIFSRFTLAFVFSYVAISLFASLFARYAGLNLIIVGEELLFLAISLIILGLIRIIFYRFIDGKVLLRRVLVLGVGKKARYIDNIRRKSDMRGFQLAGFVAAKGCQHTRVNPRRILQGGQDICSFALDNDIDEIVVALDGDERVWPERELLECRMNGVDVIGAVDFFERERTLLHLDLVQADWLIFTSGFRRSHVASLIKRSLDIVASVVILIVSAPIMLLTVVAILLEDRGKGSVFYKQERVGKGGRLFGLLKFRSMVKNAEADGVPRWATENDTRITRVGEFIRRYRVDELPQLWNVLTGDMSLVGPRPERPEFVEELTQLNSLYGGRHTVNPGITGWAQLCFPYGSSEDDSLQKLQYDLYYVKNGSFFLDLYILAQTVEAVLFKKGAR